MPNSLTQTGTRYTGNSPECTLFLSRAKLYNHVYRCQAFFVCLRKQNQFDNSVCRVVCSSGKSFWAKYQFSYLDNDLESRLFETTNMAPYQVLIIKYKKNYTS